MTSYQPGVSLNQMAFDTNGYPAVRLEAGICEPVWPTTVVRCASPDFRAPPHLILSLIALNPEKATSI
jgi:hypothetical protein